MSDFNMSQADIDAINAGKGPMQSGQADGFILGSELFNASPDFLGKYYNRTGDRITTFAKIKMFYPGRLNVDPSSSPIIGHFEAIPMKDTFKVKTVTAGATTDIATLVIDDSDVYVESTAGAPAPVTKTRPRKKDTIIVSVKAPTLVVIAKSADQKTLTVQCFDKTVKVTDLITNGQTVVVGPPISSEGTDSIAPLKKFRARYKNKFWISPEKEVITGSNLTSRGNYHMLEDGSNKIYMEGLRDVDIKAQKNISNIWLQGQMVENSIGMYSNPLEENTYLSGTQGLMDYIRSVGEVTKIDPAGMTIDDFYGITNLYHDLSIGVDTVLGILGSGVNQSIEDAVSERINYSWVIGVSDQYVPADAKPYWGNEVEKIQGAFINLGINGFELNGIKFLKTSAPEFNNGRGLGNIGYKDVGMLIPMGYIQDINKQEIPRLGYQYRGAEGYSRENEIYVITGSGNESILTGSAFRNMVKSSEWDAAQFFIRSEIAPHFAGGNEMMILEKE